MIFRVAATVNALPASTRVPVVSKNPWTTPHWRNIRGRQAPALALLPAAAARRDPAAGGMPQAYADASMPACPLSAASSAPKNSRRACSVWVAMRRQREVHRHQFADIESGLDRVIRDEGQRHQRRPKQQDHRQRQLDDDEPADAGAERRPRSESAGAVPKRAGQLTRGESDPAVFLPTSRRSA